MLNISQLIIYVYMNHSASKNISDIGNEQAKFIYDSAISVFKELRFTIEKFNEKADKLFSYWFGIGNAVLGMLLFKSEIIIQYKNLFIPALFAAATMSTVYISFFLYSKKEFIVHDKPKDILPHNAFFKLNEFYVHEAIHVQKDKIPFAEKELSKKKLGLKLMSWMSNSACVYLFLYFYVKHFSL